MTTMKRCVVLVADDEPSILKLVSFALRRQGYEVIAAADGEAAVDACHRRAGPIHLAVLDVMMPGMTGPQLFDCLKALHPKIEVLFMSGFKAEHLSPLEPGITEGNFLAKPFLPRQMLDRVNQLLGYEDAPTLFNTKTQSTGV